MLLMARQKSDHEQHGLITHRYTAARAAARTLAGLILAALILPIGCQAPSAPPGPTQTVLLIPDRDAFLDASLTLLRRYDLTPEHVDRDRGLIVTQRITGAQWFEPWRIDSRGPYQLLESSLHTIGRTVTITVEPEVAQSQPSSSSETGEAPSLDTAPAAVPEQSPSVAPDQRYRVAVLVDKARFTAEERQITAASGALAIYSERTPTGEGLRGRGAGHVRWVPLGRDALLEEYLLDKLTQVLPDVQTQ